MLSINSINRRVTPPVSTLVKHSCSVVRAFLAMANAACLGPPCSPAAKSAATDAPGLSARGPSECGGAPSRLSATRRRTPPLILRPAAPRCKSFPRRVGDASRSPCRVLGAQVQPVIAWGACLRGRQARHGHDGRGAHQEEEQAGRRRGADAPRSSAADTATRCASCPRAAALLAASPRAHRPPAHPLRGRVHLSPIELMAHLHALLLKTPTSTQRLPCLPPSLPPGCSLPDDLLEEDGFDGGLMLGACVRTSQRVR